MAIDEEEDLTTYKVVVNHEEQYSIWPVDRENPLGWEDRGPSGPKAECLAYINEVWTDMRPLSLRKRYCQLKSNWANFLPWTDNLNVEKSMSYEFEYCLNFGQIHLT